MTLSPADQKVKKLILTEVIRAYGLPGYAKPCTGCGLLADDCVCWCASCDGDGCEDCDFTGEAA